LYGNVFGGNNISFKFRDLDFLIKCTGEIEGQYGSREIKKKGSNTGIAGKCGRWIISTRLRMVNLYDEFNYFRSLSYLESSFVGRGAGIAQSV
jgi:hypothetical protein